MKQTKKKPSAFMLTINFNGASGVTSFMSKDISKDAVAFVLGMNIAQFFQQSTKTPEEFMGALDKFLVGVEDVTEKVLGPVFKDDKVSATKEIVAKLQETRGKKHCCKGKCVDKSKKCCKKARTIKKK